MKHFLLIAFAALVLAGCKGNVEEEYIKLITDATEELSNATTAEEALQITGKCEKDIREFESKNEKEINELKDDPVKSARIQKAANNYFSVVIKKSIELGSGSGDAEVQDAEE
ncbi:MAG: hypothetical protein Q4E59_07140 [Bacteroidales bacterium]|nr:hypothetical protein [Bacteroidales bacterium]